MALRILANENIPGSVVKALRANGQDVLWVKEWMPGARDEEVISKAFADGRILVTQDKDFGELVIRQGAPASLGAILFRLRGGTPEADMSRMVAAVMSRNDWGGHFVVVTDQRIRVRPLPSGAVGASDSEARDKER